MHVRRLAVVVPSMLAAMVIAGCGEDDSSGESRAFTEADLPDLVLTGSEGPKGLVFAKQESGADALERESSQSKKQAEQLHQRFGFQADYGNMFFATSRNADLQFSESIAAAFDDDEGAQGALQFLEQMQRKQGQDVEDVSAEGLGEDGWALHGVFFPGAPPTYFYTWRTGNALQIFALAGDGKAATEEAARGFVDEMEARAGG